MFNEEKSNHWWKMGLACLAVVLVTALAVDAAVTRVKAIHVSPSLAKPGQLMQGAVELSIPAPVGGVTVKLDYSLRARSDSSQPDRGLKSATLHMPSEVFIPAGKITGLFNVDVLRVDAATSVTITATLAASKQTFTAHLMPE